MTITGESLVSIENVHRKEAAGSIVNSTFETQSIKIRLYLENSTWDDRLFASIDMRDVNQTHILVKNLDLKGCDDGELFADFELIRGIRVGINKWAYLRKEYLKGVALGIVQWDPAWFKWYGPGSNQWVIWTDYANEFVYQGSWYSGCPTSAPYWEEYSHVHNLTEYVGKKWVKNWGIQMYADADTNKWEECNLDCQTCLDNKMASWVTCNPIKYYYKGIWTEQCPTPSYKAENTNYQCVPENVSSHMSVKIIKPPYLHKIPKNRQFYLKAYINNLRGNITSAEWTQISPPYTKVTSNIFTMFYNNITNEVYNTQLTLKMRMTSFTYISDSSIKIMLNVANSYGDTVSELTEFYVNSAPNLGKITQQILTPELKPEAGFSLMRFRLTGWYDEIEDQSQQLDFMFYFGDQKYLLSYVEGLETIDVKLPYISPERYGIRITISCWILAYDKYLARSTKWIDLKNVLISYNETTLPSLASYAIAADMSIIDNLLYTAASLEELIPRYYRSAIQPHICTVDFHCYNGICEQSLGSNFWKCSQGYFGTNWQYQQEAFFDLKDATENILDQIYIKYGGANEIGIFDFNIVLSALRALLKDPALLDYDKMDKIMELFFKCSNIESYITIALDENALNLYFITTERILAKIYFERKKLKIESYHLRYPGMEINQIKAAELLVKNELKFYGEQTYEGFIYFVKQLFHRLDTTTNSYSYIGSLAFEFKLKTGYPPDFEGTTYYIKESDVYWEIPFGIFTSNSNVASSVQQVYVLGVKWLANPFILNSNEFTQTGTNTTTFSLFDNDGNELDVEGLSTPISTVFPYSKNSGYNKEFLQWQYYDSISDSFKSDGCGRSFLEDKQFPCTTWAIDNSYTITDALKCRWTHLSTSGGVFKVNSVSARNDPKKGICTSFFALNYWNKSFGYYLCWTAMTVYIVGLTVAVIIDWFTLSNMRVKIEKRILDVGRKNARYKEEMKEEMRRKKMEEEKRLDATLEHSKDSFSSKGYPSKPGDGQKGAKPSYLSDDGNGGLSTTYLKDKDTKSLKPKKMKTKFLEKDDKDNETSFNNFLVPDHGEDLEKKNVNNSNSKRNKPKKGLVEEDKSQIEVDDTGLVINNAVSLFLKL
jgi:hypothetical protein